MNNLIEGFKECAHQAGAICSIPNGRLIREFGLDDFLENDVHNDDAAPTISTKAILYFCEDQNPQAPIFMFAVLAVCFFLNVYHANRKGPVPQQTMRDLVTLLRQSASAQQIRAWIASHFE